MTSDTTLSSSTATTRIDRRTILKGAAASVAAAGIGSMSKRSTYAVPAFHQATTIVLAVTSDDATKDPATAR